MAKRMLVKDVMTEKVIQISEHARLADALSKMIAHRSSCLIVVRDEHPVGIVTERDATREFAEILNHGQVIDIAVKDVMTPNPLCVDIDHDYKDALVLSRSRRLRHLPVVDADQKLVGLVTQDNLVDVYASLMEKQSALESDLEEMRLLSLEDPLMRIGNRRAMEVDLSFTQAESIRHNRHYAVALMDIDFFKKYNDHYGHQAGDQALKTVAQVLSSNARDSDRIFRYGGEEILVLMPNTDASEVSVAAERYRKLIEEAAIPHELSNFGVLTVSVGAAASGNEDWRSMVKMADQALYEAKGQGRNRVGIIR